MSGFNLQEKLIQAKAVMDKVDGSSTHNNQINNTVFRILSYESADHVRPYKSSSSGN